MSGEAKARATAIVVGLVLCWLAWSALAGDWPFAPTAAQRAIDVHLDRAGAAVQR